MLRIITAETDNNPLCSLTYDDVFSGKVKTLHDAYGLDNEFCTFYEQVNEGSVPSRTLVLSKLDRDFVVKAEADAGLDADADADADLDADCAEELAQFIIACKGRTLFVDDKVGSVIEPFLPGRRLHNHVMLYERGLAYTRSGKLMETTDYKAVYGIIKDYFNPNFDVWYTDISHRVSRGISKVYLYGGVSAATVLYDSAGGSSCPGVAFITQVATAQAARGQGSASEMLKEICSLYASGGKAPCLICRDDTIGFYEKIGFRRVGGCLQYYDIEQ